MLLVLAFIAFLALVFAWMWLPGAANLETAAVEVSVLSELPESEAA